VAGFSQLCKKLEKSFNINGKAKSTLAKEQGKIQSLRYFIQPVS
jgi:hypothetical protein